MLQENRAGEIVSWLKGWATTLSTRTFRQVEVRIIAAIIHALIVAVATAVVLHNRRIVGVVVVNFCYGVWSVRKAEPDLCSLHAIRTWVGPTGSLEGLHTLHEGV